MAENVLLAHVWDERINPAGWFVSEKLDGMRCLWLPHTKGLPSSDIPFMNNTLDKRPYICSGLWSRGQTGVGLKPIVCPSWFTNGFPRTLCLDGELYLGRGKFQQTLSVARKYHMDEVEWLNMKYCVFDTPSDVYFKMIDNGANSKNRPLMFKDVVDYLDTKRGEWCQRAEAIQIVEQVKLSSRQPEAVNLLNKLFAETLAIGGEGLMLRNPISFWEPKRSHDLLKVVPTAVGRGVVKGWAPGKKRLDGMMGALILSINQRLDPNKPLVSMELSGFTDDERKLPLQFSNGDLIQFRYRGFTDDGIPKFARYSRKVAK